MSALSPVVSSAIYDSPEAFERYFAEVRARRDARRERLRTHWQSALDRLVPEWEAAQAEQDAELTAELAAVIAQFRHLLDAPREDGALTALVETPVSLSLEIPLTPETPLPEIPIEAVVAEPSPTPPPVFEIVSALPDEATDAARNDEQQAADRAVLHTEISEIIADVQERWNALDAVGLLDADKTLNRPRCFQLRALLARLCEARTAAEDGGIGREFGRILGGLRDTICLRRQMDKDRSECFVCNEDNWTDAANLFSAAGWRDLADDYERVVVAQQAMDWYLEEGVACPAPIREALLNSIGASVTLLSETLGKVDGKDKFHSVLYQTIADNGREFFLPGISRNTYSDTLVKMADQLPEVWQNAQQTLVRAAEQIDKETRRQNAMHAVLTLCAEPDFGTNLGNVDADRARLLPLLDACKKAGIPPSNPELRESLIECAHFLLSGQSGYLNFLNEVIKEKNRRSNEQKITEGSGDQEVDDPDFQHFVEAIRPQCEGKTLLILGGDRKTPHVEEELTRLLPFAAVNWETTRKTVTAKYEPAIRRYDITCLLVSFISHELSKKGRHWAEDAGKCATLIDKGYGPRRIVKGLYEHFFGNAAAEAESIRK